MGLHVCMPLACVRLRLCWLVLQRTFQLLPCASGCEPLHLARHLAGASSSLKVCTSPQPLRAGFHPMHSGNWRPSQQATFCKTSQEAPVGSGLLAPSPWLCHLGTSSTCFCLRGSRSAANRDRLGFHLKQVEWCNRTGFQGSLVQDHCDFVLVSR